MAIMDYPSLCIQNNTCMEFCHNFNELKTNSSIHLHETRQHALNAIPLSTENCFSNPISHRCTGPRLPSSILGACNRYLVGGNRGWEIRGECSLGNHPVRSQAVGCCVEPAKVEGVGGKKRLVLNKTWRGLKVQPSPYPHTHTSF